MTTKIDQLLEKLDEIKSQFDRAGSKRVLSLVRRLDSSQFDDTELLIRFHELLLFLRAYPANSPILRLTENCLRNFSKRIEKLSENGGDISALESPETSGIAGTSVSDTFSYDIVRWLLRTHSAQVSFDWDWFEDQNRLADTWPRFMPLLEEDALVEANVPYVSWLRAARNRESEVGWLLQRIEQLAVSAKEKTALYNGQKLYVRWRFSYRASRTGMRLPVRGFFYHRDTLIARRDVNFRDELEKPAPRLVRLSRAQGRRVLDLTRETSTLRYRELYGFTHGDEDRVWHTSLGRGLDLFICGVPSERRMPIRAYHAAMIFKNGVPVGYFEGLSLFERMESGFNFYYSFREGETAWIYARVLNVFRHLLGVTAFSIDPYQIGFENEEGIESGAFWFYRKLGFRPVRPELLALTEKEEAKIAKGRSYRSSPAVLRRLAEGPMILELDTFRSGDWDRFSVRNIGLKVQREMAAKFQGDALKMRTASAAGLLEKLGAGNVPSNEIAGTASSDLAVTVDLIPDVRSWSQGEKDQLARIITAKAGADEGVYLKLLQKHERLRRAIIELGS